ncbi:hypothetical protein [Deinococcus roseus]|uniref:Uncharacterized protein n=1 Tax=Deinococcus roseus TaxID=392414 RepID=A0ABQ2DIS3_9DEIO|nr:hypothetical protein [Deinococcus roseus]GGJ59434.1 hypothetical protein GCM10008938_51970 [Deinococcus roseus]
MARKKNYQNLEALVPVERILSEASMALQQKTRTLATSSIPDVLGAVVGTLAGGAASAAWIGAAAVTGTTGAAALTSGLAGVGAVIGGGMVAGLAVAALPVAALAVGGYAVINRRNHKRLLDRERALLQDAMLKHQALIEQLQSEMHEGQERRDYLQRLVIVLSDAIKNMQEDLGAGGLATEA